MIGSYDYIVTLWKSMWILFCSLTLTYTLIATSLAFIIIYYISIGKFKKKIPLTLKISGFFISQKLLAGSFRCSQDWTCLYYAGN